MTNTHFGYVENLPMITLPEEYEGINRFHAESYKDYTITRLGNMVDGSQVVTVYDVSKDDHTVYVLSNFYNGSYWCMEN